VGCRDMGMWDVVMWWWDVGCGDVGMKDVGIW